MLDICWDNSEKLYQWEVFYQDTVFSATGITAAEVCLKYPKCLGHKVTHIKNIQ